MSTSNRTYRRLIQKAAAKAAQATRTQDRWHDDPVVLVAVTKSPLCPRTRSIWVKQLCGLPFDFRNTQFLHCGILDYPIWLGSDGELYEVALDEDNAIDPASPLTRAKLEQWPKRGLYDKYDLALKKLRVITDS